MKKIILLIILLSTLAISTETRTIDMKIGDSIKLENKNITLVNFDDDDEKIIICVNNLKYIISDEKRVNDVFIDIKSFNDNSVRLKIEVDCNLDNCECDKSCLNDKCFSQKKCRVDRDCNDNNKFTKDQCVNNSCINEYSNIDQGTQNITIKQEKTNYNLFLLLGIPIIILLAIIIYLAIKK